MLAAVVLAALSVGLLTYAGLDAATSDDRRVRGILEDLSAYEKAEAQAVEPLLRPFHERVLLPLVDAMVNGLRNSGFSAYRDRVAAHLDQAGHPSGLDADRFLALKLAAAFVVAFLAVPASLFSLLTGNLTGALLWLALVAFAQYVPDMWLDGRVAARKKEIRRSLPDVLDMLTVSVEAGLGFDSALGKLANKSGGAIGEEFAITLREIQAGAARKDALRHLAERTDVPELKTFVMAMIQADVFGVSVSHILRTQSVELRTRRRQQAEEEAQKAPVKLVFPLIFFLLPATLLIAVGPALMMIGKLMNGMGH